MTKMLTIWQASANMLMIPEVKSSSTVSTSPTKRDTVAPGSCRTRRSAGRRSSFWSRAERMLCVIFCPSTVRRHQRREQAHDDGAGDRQNHGGGEQTEPGEGAENDFTHGGRLLSHFHCRKSGSHRASGIPDWTA